MTSPELNFKQYIEERYGPIQFQNFRKLEGMYKKYAAAKESVTFLCKCREYKIIPKGLRLKNPCPTEKSERIIKNASAALVWERIQYQRKKQSVKVTTKTECIDCQGYQRKIKEAENNVSSRNVLIQMLHDEVHKVENLYKDLIDSYENLRFAHCTAVQELGTFKQSYKQVEEENERIINEKKAISIELTELKQELGRWKNLYQDLSSNLSNQKKCACMPKDDLKRIENTIQQKNNSLKEILHQLADDLQKVNTRAGGVEANAIPNVGCDGKLSNLTCNTKEQLVENIKILETRIDHLVNLTNSLQNENKQIKSSLADKMNKVTSCLAVIEKNNEDISRLCSNIEDILKERDQNISLVQQLKDIIEKNKSEIFLKETALREFQRKYENLRSQKEDIEKKLNYKTDVKERNICGLQCYVQAIDEETLKEKSKNQTEIDKYRQLANALESEIENQGKALSEIQYKYQILIKEKNEVECLISQQIDINSKKSKEICGLTCYVRALIEEFDAEKDKYQTQIAERARRSDSLERKIADQQNRQAEFQNMYDKLKGEKDKLETQLITQLNQTSEEKSRDICGLKCYIQTMNQEIIKEIDNYKNEVDKYHRGSETLKQDMEEQEKLHEFRVNKYENHIRQLEERNKALTRSVDELTSSLKNFEENSKDICGLKCYVNTINDEIVKENETNKNEINKYVQMLDALQKQIKDLEDRNQSLTEDLNKSNTYNEEYKDKLAELNKKSSCQDFNGGVQDEMVLEIEELKKDLENAQLEISEYEEQTKFHSQKIDSLANQLDHVNEEKLRLSDDTEESSKRMIQQYESLVEEKEKTISRNQGEIEILKQQQDKMIVRNRDLERKLQGAEREKTKLQTDIDELSDQAQKQLLAIQEKLNNLQQQDRLKEAKLDSALNTIEENQEKNKQLEKSYTDRIKQLESKNRALDDENAKLKTNLTTYQDKYKDCDCEGGIKVLNLDVDATDLHKLRADLCQKQCIIYKLEQCIDNSNQILGECEKEIKEMHCQNECLQRQNASLRIHLDNRLHEIDIHEADKEMIGSENDKLRQCLEDYRDIEAKVLKVTQEYNKLQQECNAKDAEIENMKRQYQILDNCCKNFGNPKKSAAISQEIKSILSAHPNKSLDRKYAKDLEQTLDQKNQEIQYLKRKADNLTSEIGCLKQNVHKLILNNNKIKAAVSSLVSEIMNKLNILLAKDGEADYRRTVDIAADIMKSLTKLEESVSSPDKPNKCPIPKCTCMTEIISSYSEVHDPTKDSDESVEVIIEDLTSRPSCYSKQYTIASSKSMADNCEGCFIGQCTDCPSVTHCLE